MSGAIERWTKEATRLLLAVAVWCAAMGLFLVVIFHFDQWHQTGSFWPFGPSHQEWQFTEANRLIANRRPVSDAALDSLMWPLGLRKWGPGGWEGHGLPGKVGVRADLTNGTASIDFYPRWRPSIAPIFAGIAARDSSAIWLDDWSPLRRAVLRMRMQTIVRFGSIDSCTATDFLGLDWRDGNVWAMVRRLQWTRSNVLPDPAGIR